MDPALLLHRRVWVAAMFVAAAIVTHQVLIQPALTQLSLDAPIINIAGRQRMLSQKLAKEALALASAVEPTARASRAQRLSETLSEWSRAHRGLRYGDPGWNHPAGNSAEIDSRWEALNSYFEQMADAARQLASTPASAELTAIDRQHVQTILDQEPEFLSRMDALVGEFERQMRRHATRLRLMGWMLMGLILAVGVATQSVVVSPAVKGLGREFAQSEAAYQQLVESMSEGLVTFDPTGRINFANLAFATMLGYEHTPIVGKPVSLFLVDADRRRFDSLLVGGSTTDQPLDVRWQHVNGSTVETMVSAERVTRQATGAEGLLLVVTNVTERRTAERQAELLSRQLKHADRLHALGGMAAGIAHEINQPLGAIANYAEGALARLSQSGTTLSELELPLQGILRSALRGGEIVKRTRSFVKRSAHRLTPESLNDLVREVETLCAPEARQRGIALECRLTVEPTTITVDGIQIQQVLVNLVQNAFAAVESVDPYHRRVRISTRRLELGLEFDVTDSGPGVPDSLRDQMFEPFVTGREDGTGLGLSIAREIVAAHGGSIAVDQPAEWGARFRVVLPFSANKECPVDG